MDARDEADVLDEPGAECSARMVVRWAIQVLFWGGEVSFLGLLGW